MDFPLQMFFNDINHGYRAAILKKSSLWLLPSYMAVATYCYYEKVRRMMYTAIVSNLLKWAPLMKPNAARSITVRYIEQMDLQPKFLFILHFLNTILLYIKSKTLLNI